MMGGEVEEIVVGVVMVVVVVSACFCEELLTIVID